MPSVRAPAAAGRFYPADPAVLARLVDAMLDVAPPPPDEPLAAAYVVPHAGYRYSGPTASRVYGRLRVRAPEIRRVVLIGPAHYKPLRGCAVPSTGKWLTPLGAVAVDSDGCRALVDSGHATVDDEPHAPEHSLEVQLPFLQRALGAELHILPIATGPSTMDAVARTIEAARGGDPATVVVCSTDLSHYLDEAAANAQDERTVEAVLALEPGRLGVGDACGFYALRGLVVWGRSQLLTPRLLHRSTSADATGESSRVVGYAALAFADAPSDHGFQR